MQVELLLEETSIIPQTATFSENAADTGRNLRRALSKATISFSTLIFSISFIFVWLKLDFHSRNYFHGAVEAKDLHTQPWGGVWPFSYPSWGFPQPPCSLSTALPAHSSRSPPGYHPPYSQSIAFSPLLCSLLRPEPTPPGTQCILGILQVRKHTSECRCTVGRFSCANPTQPILHLDSCYPFTSQSWLGSINAALAVSWRIVDIRGVSFAGKELVEGIVAFCPPCFSSYSYC